MTAVPAGKPAGTEGLDPRFGRYDVIDHHVEVQCWDRAGSGHRGG